MAQINRFPGESHFLLPEPQPRVEYSRSYALDIDGDEGPQGLAYYWHIAWARKGILMLAAVVGAAAGLLLTMTQRRIYRVHSALEIQNISQDYLNVRDVMPNTPQPPEIDIQTQVRVFQSQTLIEETLDSMDLGDRPLLRQEPSFWRAALRLRRPKPVPLRDQVLADAMAGLKVRTQPSTRIVELTFDSTDPRFAVDFVNTLVAKFSEDSMEARWQASQRTGQRLSRQMQDLRTRLSTSQEQVQRYAEAFGLLFTSNRDNVAEDKLRQAQVALSNAQAERVARQSKWEIAASSPIETLPEVLDDPGLRQLQSTLTDLRRQAAELSSTLTPANPKVVKIQAQIASVQSALEKERANITRRIRNEYEAARRRENLLAADYTNQARLISAQAAKVARYDVLKREVDATRQLYESIVQKVKEAAIVSALRDSNVRVIDPARQPGAPYKPAPTTNAALGMLTCTFAAFGLTLMRERSDRRIRAPGDTCRHLNVPELGIVPACKLNGPRHFRLPALDRSPIAAGSLGLLPPSVEAADANPPAARVELIVDQQKRSIAADCFRNVLASIPLPGKNGELLQIVALSSAVPGEGKTMVSSNLAIALAESNLSVLLIDGDMRRPSIHNIFGLSNSCGFSECLKQPKGAPLSGFVCQTRIPGVSVIPAGASGAPDLVHSPRLSELLREMRLQFDIILIDTPPTLLFPDARILARHADAAILVVRAGRTTRDTALLAHHRLCADGTRMVGTILNDFDPRRDRRQTYCDYYHHYGQYYGDRRKPRVF